MRRAANRMALAVLVATAVARPVGAATFVVSTTGDTGAGSLRQAILDANAAAGTDTITFAIADTGVPQITPATNLPTITDAVDVDATTQTPAGRVELTGTTTTGFAIATSGVTIRGFVINGFTTAGIAVGSGGSATIAGNYIGTNVAGTASASPASAAGITITSAGGTQIGGYTAADRNVLSGNGTGISVSGVAASANVVVGNYIGTDATGLAAVANASFGIGSFLTSAVTVGGTAAGAGNVIAGNGSDGVAISGNGWVVQRNLVGLGADGTTAVPNGRHGVRLFNTAAGALVGGAAPNTIAYNKSAGVLLAVNAGTGNAILSNVIHDNGALGIDINGSGVNPNDPGDADTGSNLGQNFPVLDAAFAGGGSIDGVLDSTPATSFTIELFANAACDPTGYGEGAELVGSLDVTTDVTGHAAFTATLSRTIDASEYVTATATDTNGNTSEFSACAPPFPTTTTTSASTSSTTTSSSTSTSTSTTDVTTSSTSTSSLDPATTTSTSLAPATTTSTSLPEGTTTTSTTADTTSSTSTTSTSLPTTTSTSTVAPSTSTSTSLAAATTTSTSSSTTSTTGVGSPTTTSTRAPSSTTSSTSTSTTTLGAPSTTTTTQPPCVGVDCPDAGCGTQVAFAPLRCRLAGLTATIDDTTELAPMRAHLDRHLGRARTLLDKAEARCGLAKRAPAKRGLRGVRRRLGKVGRMLQMKLVRRTVPTTVTDPLVRRTSALAGDVRTLSAGLVCP